MAVTRNTYPAGEHDQIHNIKFIVRNPGSPDLPGQTDGNQGGTRTALIAAIIAGTISVTGLEVVRDC